MAQDAPGGQDVIAMTMQLKPESIVIEPARGRQVVNWRELREYRDLFYFLIDRDIKVLYKQTVLGLSLIHI